MLKQITPLSWLGIIILFNTTLIGSATQLPDLLLPPLAIKFLVAFATIGNGFLGGLVTMFGGATAMRDTLGNRGDVVLTNRANADATPNRNVIATTPAMSVAVQREGAAPIVG